MIIPPRSPVKVASSQYRTNGIPCGRPNRTDVDNPTQRSPDSCLPFDGTTDGFRGVNGGRLAFQHGLQRIRQFGRLNS